MPPFLKRIRRRTAERINRAAIGATSEPAGSEPAPPDAAGKPSARERGRMRRRLRELERVLEAKLLDLGALTFELQRQQRRDTALVERKAKEAIAVDAEARGLADALDQDRPLSAVVAAGIAGTCVNCEAIISTGARFCSICGTAVGTPPAKPATSDGSSGNGHQKDGAEHRAPAPWAKDLK